MMSPGRWLRRDSVLVVAALAVLWMLTAAWVASGAGLGMTAWDMTRAALWPRDHATSSMGAMVAWDARGIALMVAMWWTMMVAMMIPAATPIVLLYSAVRRQHATAADAAATAPVAFFVSGYVLVWGVFSAAATALHFALVAAELVTAGTMGVPSSEVAGGVLVAAGLYQLSPWKNACLASCRAPAAFLSRHWRAGRRGAVRLGVVHGAVCVGCCWALMALLFVGGVMNLVWIAVLSALVLAERVVPAGRHVGAIAGAALVAWGVAMFAGWIR